MKTSRLIGIVIIAANVMWTSAVQAGDLTPPGPPGSTMHTLEEIHQQLLTTQQDVADLQKEVAELKQRMATDGMAPTIDGMVLVPAGPFQMGDIFAEGDADELPVHTVTSTAFYMEQYEVTKAQWDEVANWAETNGYDITAADGMGKENSHPVYNVSWYDCVKWANARSEKELRTPCYFTGSGTTTVYRSGTLTIEDNWVLWGANGYRLPTEAEWEKAARGGARGRRFPWADANLIDHYRANYHGNPSIYSYDTSLVADDHPAFNDGIPPYTSPVGSFAPNGYGLYDMAGNVWNWCWDWYDPTYYASSPGTDPRGPALGAERVARGGYWHADADYCRVAARKEFTPGGGHGAVGVRLVRASQ